MSTPLRAVHQLLGALHAGDAVGHEALVIRDALRGAGHPSEIFAGFIDPELTAQARPLADYASASGPETVCLFHFAPGSPATRLALGVCERLALVFHNLTPPEFLAPFAKDVARAHVLGLGQLRAFASRASLALAHSDFSRRDLVRAGFAERARVLPFAVDLDEKRVAPAPVVRTLFGDGHTNLLFVGRIAPNKRIEDLLRVFAAYRRLAGERNRLLLVGHTAGFPGYLQSLHALRRELRLEDVLFTGHVNDAELQAYYSVAAAFVCLSEHEGFGVPLVEAMLRDVPVLAFDAAAVAETLQGGGVLLRDKRPALVAELLHEILTQPTLREAVLVTQRRAAKRWRSVDFKERLLAELRPLVA